ncbi:MAG TPA: N,N-dimethylformamidase beta subunit family domain-containing protein [Gaiellaceae bacterium]|jgi:hypothetical protein|nr:N,N-dimethylformamidase beta subunit family domain-containing protein [Gaiellaceae bacterium]
MRLRLVLIACGSALVLTGAVGAHPAKPPRPKHHKRAHPVHKTHKPAPPPAPPPLSPVVRENELPGTPGWLGPIATSRAAELYASATDAIPGETIALHVSVGDEARYRIIVYRLGWYGGIGARQVACLPGCDDSERGTLQPVPEHETVGRGLVAGWPTTDTLKVDDNWVSGYYLVRVLLLSGAQTGNSATTYVVVNQPDSMSRMLVQVPVTTWQAYNGWGGRSLYDMPGLGRRANHVSFDRPYWWSGPGGQGPLGWELPFVRFIEEHGYDVSYQSDVYTDAHPDSLLHHKLVAVAGHDEYWTGTMRDAFDAARDQGEVNLAFMGANDGYWQIKLQDADRTIVAYKSMSDPEPDVRAKTAMFREVGRRECELLGIQHQGASPLNWPPGDYTVPAAAADDPWLHGTGFEPGAVVEGIVSVESDTIPGTETAGASCGHSLTVLFHREHGGDKDGNADAIRYTNFNGAIVFASGSHQFSWGLDDFATDPDEGHGYADPRLQKFMSNALDAMTK